MIQMKRSSFGLLLVAAVAIGGCRHTVSDKPPMHINPNMDFQERLDPQEASGFFADGRAMRPPVPGTVARGFLRDETRFYAGRNADNSFVRTSPVPISMDVVKRGQDRYDIYCAPCHGKAGDGLGPIMTGNYGYVPAPSYHTADMRAVPDGHLYDVVANGIRTMPGYAQQIPVADRWAIVTYIRALQLSQNAVRDDIPQSILAEIEQGSSANINTRDN